MATATLNGPVVRAKAHNVVLRDALLHSPDERNVSSTNYHTIRVGVREGEFTTWIGTFNQSTRAIAAATPTSILDVAQKGRRLKENQALVVEVSTTGSPLSLRGARVNFRMGRVGGRDGPPRPLVATARSAVDPNARTALDTLERQVNGSLSEWEEAVQLRDPAELAPLGTFHGRIQVDSTTEISLQRYIGNWIEVGGDAVSITSGGASRDVADGLLEATGGVGSSVPSSENLYYVYVSKDIDGLATIRLSATAPAAHKGTLYLGTDESAGLWRFVGYVWVDDSTQFTDSETARLCCNYYNRLVKDMYFCPAYVNDNTLTSYVETNTIGWVPAHGDGKQIAWISNNEDAVVVHATASVSNSGAFNTELGIGIDQATTAARAGIHQGTEIGNIALHYSDVLSATRHTAVMITKVSAGTGTYIADDERYGGTEDPPMTYISGQVLV